MAEDFSEKDIRDAAEEMYRAARARDSASQEHAKKELSPEERAEATIVAEQIRTYLEQVLGDLHRTHRLDTTGRTLVIEDDTQITGKQVRGTDYSVMYTSSQKDDERAHTTNVHEERFFFYPDHVNKTTRNFSFRPQLIKGGGLMRESITPKGPVFEQHEANKGELLLLQELLTTSQEKPKI